MAIQAFFFFLLSAMNEFFSCNDVVLRSIPLNSSWLE
ncbi:uncharacterized protein G2W53_038585 [Senna tora]|uniref:Uncharacterized protein n=1 Tax=Senna tora TaxID=362788 RepID=A0A834SLX1_9FABA|nr:uncharacterized protein G2W53_038585 [Senna tora]